MGGVYVDCFWEAKSVSGEVVSWPCYCGKERVLERRWHVNWRRVDYLSTAKFYEKRA